jgi:hypothetical protein
VITIPDRGAVPVLSPRKLQRIILRKKMNLKLPSVKVVKCDVSGSEVSKDYQKSPSAEREEIDVIGRWRRSRTRTVRFGVSTTLPPAQSAACVDPFRALFGSASFVNNLPFTPFYYLHNHNRYECCYDCRPRRPTPLPLHHGCGDSLLCGQWQSCVFWREGACGFEQGIGRPARRVDPAFPISNSRSVRVSEAWSSTSISHEHSHALSALSNPLPSISAL